MKKVYVSIILKKKIDKILGKHRKVVTKIEIAL